MDYEKAVAISKEPKNFKKMEDAALKETAVNARCGDNITLYLRVDKGRIMEASFHGVGCAAAIAGCSVLTEAIKNVDLSNALQIGEDAIKKSLNTDRSERRAKCAFLCIDALSRLAAREGKI